MSGDPFPKLEAFLADIPEPVDSRTKTPFRTSMLYWFERVAGAGLPVPRTDLVRFDNRTLWPAMDLQPTPDVPWDEFVQAANRIGYPCFVRGDLSSAKHDGPAAYRLEGPDDIQGKLIWTFHDNCLKDQEVLAFAFREWLDLDSSFDAFGSRHPGHPIAREFRIFADSQQAWCEHFYWPQDAIEGHNPTAPDWKDRLSHLARPLGDEEGRHLRGLAVEAVRALQEKATARWSVDFAQDRAGKWWLIDMAVAELSWHPDGCPH